MPKLTFFACMDKKFDPKIRLKESSIVNRRLAFNMKLKSDHASLPIKSSKSNLKTRIASLFCCRRRENVGNSDDEIIVAKNSINCGNQEIVQAPELACQVKNFESEIPLNILKKPKTIYSGIQPVRFFQTIHEIIYLGYKLGITFPKFYWNNYRNCKQSVSQSGQKIEISNSTSNNSQPNQKLATLDQTRLFIKLLYSKKLPKM